MTTFIPFDTRAALEQIAATAPDAREAEIAERIVAPFQGMFTVMAGGGSDARVGQVAAARGWQMAPPEEPSEAYWQALDQIEAGRSMERALEGLERADRALAEAGVATNIETVLVGIFPFHPGNPQVAFTGGYTGFGAIAGYIILKLWPDDYTLPRVPPAAVHELNHQVRFLRHPFSLNVSVGEYCVDEGLAESFAAQLYGADLVGPWVTNQTDEERERAKVLIGKDREKRGFNAVRPYIFGDDFAAPQGRPAIGMPRHGGYTVGYHLVQAYLRNTGQTAAQATILPAEEIIAGSRYFAEES